MGRAEHFRLIRTDASYRNFLMLEEMQAEMQPSLASSQNIQEPLKEREQWSPKQWDTVNQLRSQVKHLSNKVVELSKSSNIYNSKSIYSMTKAENNPFKRDS